MGDYNDAFMRNQNAAAVQARVKPPQNRANIQQLKLIGQSHPTGLTANLLKLFEPRPPLEFKPPPEKRKCPPYTGMAQFVSHFAEPGDPEYAPPVQEAETHAQRRARIHKLRLEKGMEKAAEELKNYDPNSDPNISGDPYKTLFVARLNYETSESRIKREFESYGPIKRVRLVTGKSTNKPRGYAFIEYMHTRDMKAAYKQADGRKIDGKRVLVDVERGRTVPNWRPRRLGGGLGTTRIGGEDVTQREQVQSGPSRSEEPRIREDPPGDREREKSRDRGRERERDREKSRERSHDRPRGRDREDRHHKDSERTRDRDRERERDRGRDRDRARERGRDRGRDYERDRERDRERDTDRDYDVGNYDRDRGRSKDRDRDRESDYDRVESKHERDRHSERDFVHGEPDEDHGWYEQHDHGHRRSDEDNQHYYDHQRGRGEYDLDAHGDRYDQYDRDRDRYDGMEEDDYR
ncbi:U1 small nuclear ribonucleoprotein 70 kDa [Hibiscus syriacus]|uniref:U1 small nuclear ribonucleoprotein 70 kDa n=1 Tax=Hibiscus syriacus TaxID=106335 RepID=A0A6A3BRH8_HIBSY|nr:U1 small nuclear ribonucleoprotein 70 kDa-like [Hibiscus syriacus]KAE8718501.1 U1 small nuclear ribonucleoprotein 70 kDa [Hibiscus syriacus]